MTRHLLGASALGRVAALVLAIAAAGCAPPLAYHDEYFRPGVGTAAGVAVGTEYAITHQRAARAVYGACRSLAPAAPVRPGPDLGADSGRAALSEVCAAAYASTHPVAARGPVSDAYRRWEEGQPRPLRAPSETAASAAGGS